MSLEALAVAANTSNQQVSLLEAGKRRLTVDWLIRLSRALDCHPWELVSSDLPRPPSASGIRLLDRFQRLTEPQQAAVLELLDVFAPHGRPESGAVE